MRRLLAISFMMLLGLGSWTFADDPKPAVEKDELKLFQGNWKVVALEENGNKAPTDALEGMRWEINGSELIAVDPGDERSPKVTFKLDSNKSPKQIDLSGDDPVFQGKAIESIYKFEKDKLIICTRDPNESSKGRPTSFKTEADSGLGMITLERIKK